MNSKLFTSTKFFLQCAIAAFAILFIALIFKNTKKDDMSKDVYNAAFLALSGVPAQGITLTTNSRNEEFLTGKPLDGAVFAAVSSFESQKVFSIASITKTFTAATLVKLANDEKYKDFFDKQDPMGTKIADFEVLIARRGGENVEKYFEKLKKNHPQYQEITLRHLLNHTSGVAHSAFFDEFRKDESRSFHLQDHAFLPQIIENGFGKFQYSDANYNYLLAPIIELVVSAAQDHKIGFSEIVKEQIIAPLGLHHSFMNDEVALKDGHVVVKSHPEIVVAQGFDYFDGKVQVGQDFNYDCAAGGIYASAQDVAIFYQALIDGTLLGEKAGQIFFDEKNFVNSDDTRNTAEKRAEGYGLGIRKIEAGGVQYFHHGGAGIGAYSHVIAQKNSDGKVQVASVMLSYENVTRPIAAALLGDEKKKDGNYFVDEILSNKMEELARNHSQEQLIAMRKDLDLAHGDFSKKSDEFQKVYAEKYARKTPSPMLDPKGVEQLRSQQVNQH